MHLSVNTVGLSRGLANGWNARRIHALALRAFIPQRSVYRRVGRLGKRTVGELSARLGGAKVEPVHIAINQECPPLPWSGSQLRLESMLSVRENVGKT